MANILQAQNDLENGFAVMINTAGTDFELEDLDGNKQTIKCHVVPASKDDEAIINALGADATFMHTLATPILKKFQNLTAPSGRVYVIDAAHEIYVNNTLVGQRVIAR